MRSLAALALFAAAAAACGGFDDRGVGEPGYEDDGPGAGLPRPRQPCDDDSDCVAVGATCCGAPSYAVNRDDPSYRACAGVSCPDPEMGSDVAAVCSAAQQCELACPPTETELACVDGFDRSTGGCLVASCAVRDAQCTLDSECVRTREDCCGCARGGRDTAVPASQRAAFDAALGCDDEPACPGIDSCTDELPTCAQGRCDLLPPLPVGACGRRDLPSCAPSETCMLNINDVANLHGVGICTPR